MSDKSLFDGMPSKSSFWLGLAAGLGVMFALGFFIMLGMAFNDKDAAPTAVAPSAPTAVAPTPNAPQPTTGTPPAVQDSDHVKGPKNAKVTLIEFSDIQCPFCSRFHPTVKQVLTTYPNDVRVVYKHFPLDSIHPEARPAAIASECLFEQKGNDAFFTYIDNLFALQTSLGRALYVSEAKKLGADEAKFIDCLDTGRMAAKVEADYQAGLAAGVTGTPGSFVNNQIVRGALPFETVKQMIDAELNK